MRTEKEIRERIAELEDYIDDEDNYLDESEQSELMTLYWVLGENEITN